jgi:hypothetical protein
VGLSSPQQRCGPCMTGRQHCLASFCRYPPLVPPYCRTAAPDVYSEVTWDAVPPRQAGDGASYPVDAAASFQARRHVVADHLHGAKKAGM